MGTSLRDPIWARGGVNTCSIPSRKEVLERTRPSSAVRFRVIDPVERTAQTDNIDTEDFWVRELSRQPVIGFQGDVDT